MSNISSCLDLINDVNDQMFLAECDVMLSNDIWLSKISEMVDYYGNSDDIIGYIQEAEYGRRDVGGNKWLNKIRIFILKCIDKIVDAITNFLLKIKTRKADYVRIPYKYEDLMEDIDLVKSIDKELYQIFDNVESFASDDNIRKLTAIKEKLKSTHFAKKERIMVSDKDPEAHNKLNKYGVKPDQYITLAKDLRNLNRALKDTKRRASKMVGDDWLKGSESTDKSRTTVTELLFNIYTEMSKMIVKLMRSFTVSGVEKMNKSVIEKHIKTIDFQIKNLRVIINKPEVVNNSYYDDDIDDDLEYFDETEKPYDAYLKKHDYDPKTNTIEVDGKRVNAGAIGSKKERNRINKFLRENNYDPKTETIETDIKNKDGSYKRIKFSMDNTDDTSHHPETWLDEEKINVDTKRLGAKPRNSNQAYKHEEGHAAQASTGAKHKYSESEHKSDNDTVSTSKENIHKFIDDNPVDGDSHYQDFELDADLYGYQHNRYASKDTKRDKTSIQHSVDKGTRYVNKKINDLEKSKENVQDDATKKLVKSVWTDLRSDLTIRKNKLSELCDELRYVRNAIIDFELKGEYDDTTELKKRKEELAKDIYDCKKIIDKINENLEKIKNKDYNIMTNYNITTDTSIRVPLLDRIDIECERRLDKISDDMDYLKRIIDTANLETDNRNKFLDQHADEGGSKARKLEGRQGKHKGKK